MKCRFVTDLKVAGLSSIRHFQVFSGVKVEISDNIFEFRGYVELILRYVALVCLGDGHNQTFVNGRARFI